MLKVAGWANLTFGEDEGGEEGGIPGGMGRFNLGLGGQILYVALTVASLIGSLYKLGAEIAENGVLGVLRNSWKSIKGIIPAAKAALRDAGSLIKAGWNGLRNGLRGLFLPRSPLNRAVGSSNPISWLADGFRGWRLRGLHANVVREVDAAIAAGDRAALRALGAGRGEIRRVLQGGAQAAKFRGSIIDTATKARAARTWGLRSLISPGRFQYGPDFWNPRTMRAWDMTTPGQWAAHMVQYITNPPAGRPVWRQLFGLIH